MKLFGNFSNNERHIAEFYYQAGFIVKSNIHIAQAIKILKEQQYAKEMKATLAEIYAKMLSGIMFSEALAQYPNCFSKSEIAYISAAEESGTLGDALVSIGKMKMKRLKLKTRILLTLIYPAFILASALVSFTITAAIVSGHFMPSMEYMNIKMPFYASYFYSTAKFLANPYNVIISILAIYALCAALKLAYAKNKNRMDDIVWNMPIIGKFIKNKTIGKMCEHIALLSKNGKSLTDAIESAAESSDNYVGLKLGKAIKNGIFQGEELENIFKKHLPKMLAGFIAAGEKTGKVPESLMSIAQYCEWETEKYLENLEKIIDPILIILLGLGLGCLIICFIKPIYDLSLQLR